MVYQHNKALISPSVMYHMPLPSLCLDTGSCSPPGAVGSSIVRKQPSGRVQEWCHHHQAPSQRWSCHIQLQAYQPRQQVSMWRTPGSVGSAEPPVRECRCLWKTGNSLCQACAGSVRAVKVRVKFILTKPVGFFDQKIKVTITQEKKESCFDSQYYKCSLACFRGWVLVVTQMVDTLETVP